MEPLEEARATRDRVRREVHEILARIEACVARGDPVPEELNRECAARLAVLQEAHDRVARLASRQKMGLQAAASDREWT